MDKSLDQNKKRGGKVFGTLAEGKKKAEGEH